MRIVYIKYRTHPWVDLAFLPQPALLDHRHVFGGGECHQGVLVNLHGFLVAITVDESCF